MITEENNEPVKVAPVGVHFALALAPCTLHIP